MPYRLAEGKWEWNGKSTAASGRFKERRSSRLADCQAPLPVYGLLPQVSRCGSSY